MFQDSKKKKGKSRKSALSSSESASPRREFTAHFKACVASAREDVSKRRKDELIARLGGTAVTSLARYIRQCWEDCSARVCVCIGSFQTFE